MFITFSEDGQSGCTVRSNVIGVPGQDSLLPALCSSRRGSTGRCWKTHDTYVRCISGTAIVAKFRDRYQWIPIRVPSEMAAESRTGVIA